MELMGEFEFECVILDAKLPDMDGLELASKIRKLDNQVPILIVSGYFYKDDPTVVESLKKGLITGFVSKPFCHLEIYEAIGAGTGGTLR
jgi:FixJ family two-component response regulator